MMKQNPLQSFSTKCTRSFKTPISLSQMIFREVLEVLKRYHDPLMEITFYVNNKQFRAFVPHDQLWIAVKDVLLDREYEYVPHFELSNFVNKTIVDAGAHVGLYTLLAASFAGLVVSLEPHPVNFRLLNINIEVNTIKNAIARNVALWSKKTTLTLYQGEHTAAHSLLLSRTHERINYEVRWSAFNVSTTTLTEIISEFGKVDLLKLDVEGSEYVIIKRTPKVVFKDIDCIVGEVHFLDTNAARKMLKDIIKRLQELGFNVVVVHPPIRRSRFSYTIKLNGLYILKLLRTINHAAYRMLRLRFKNVAMLYAINRK